jgi:hypothetical protein
VSLPSGAGAPNPGAAGVGSLAFKRFLFQTPKNKLFEGGTRTPNPASRVLSFFRFLLSFLNSREEGIEIVASWVALVVVPPTQEGPGFPKKRRGKGKPTMAEDGAPPGYDSSSFSESESSGAEELSVVEDGSASGRTISLDNSDFSDGKSSLDAPPDPEFDVNGRKLPVPTKFTKFVVERPGTMMAIVCSIQCLFFLFTVLSFAMGWMTLVLPLLLEVSFCCSSPSFRLFPPPSLFFSFFVFPSLAGFVSRSIPFRGTSRRPFVSVPFSP